MATEKSLNGKPYVENLHVRFDEREVVSAATPRRGIPLYRKVVMIALLCCVGVFNAFGVEWGHQEINGIGWYYKISGTTIALGEGGNGTSTDDVTGRAIYTAVSGHLYIPMTFTDGNVTRTVTSISGHAFQNCGMSSCQIPWYVASIGNYAFANCGNLESVSIPYKVRSIGENAFAGCANLKKVDISYYILPECELETIGAYAFNNCSQMTDLTIPVEVVSIATTAFSGCSALNTITAPTHLSQFSTLFPSAYAKIKSVTIPSGTVVINNQMFMGCSSITNIVIPEGVTSMGEAAFKGCSSLTHITLPSTLTNISANAFHGCTKLKSIVIPTDSVVRIGDNAFYGCSSLTDIILPPWSSVKSIGTGAFHGCSKLTNVVVCSATEPQTGTAIYEGCPSSLITYTTKTWGITGDTWQGRALKRVDNLSAAVQYWIMNNMERKINGSSTTIQYTPGNASEVTVLLDNEVLLSSTNGNNFTWQPQSTGKHILKHSFGDYMFVSTANVTRLNFFVQPAPNAPMAKNNNISITPTTRSFGVEGGGNAIITSGSGTWTAAVSDPWITLNATSGAAGYPVAYTVSATTNVEQRVGYVYVSGWTHTITQDGHGATITRNGSSNDSVSVDNNGGKGTIYVHAANKMVWQARPNVDWLSVTPTSGAGEGSVTYQVAPYNEVSTRQGTLTVAGNTFSVFQYGRRMKLDSYSTTQNYETHVIPITVNALAITQWSVTPNNSWISVVDAGNGQGGDLVTIAIAENPSYKARTGTVTIGTETFTVTQQGRPTAALSFSVSPTASTASVEGANGIIAVTATPDLPWTATSGANWLTVYAATASGAGNGNVVYNASPNPTLSQRTGNITVTPEAASGMTAKTHKVTQPAATAALSSNGYEFETAGESCSVDVSVANIVQWSISESLDWITVNGSTSRTGPGTVTLQAAANDTVYPRSGTVTIAGKTFSVSQKARGVELEYDTKLFGTDGGSESISIHPDGNVAWTAVASDATWITIFQGDSGTGDGEIMYIVSPYVGDGSARTGWITVGDKKVYITQRAYDLSIEPNGTNVVGNAGAGEFGVSASISDVWTAIVTEPWITLVSGYDSGTGNGTVRFLYTENTTGKTRTGKIIVAGEVYTLEQRARTMVAITATAEHGGRVSGGGSYDLGTEVVLTAVPDSGYQFSYWTGSVSSMQNPLTLTADVAKSVAAVFTPMPIAFSGVESKEEGVSLAWNNLAWAATYRIYRGVTSVPSSATVLAELPNSGSCAYLDETGDVDVEYWYWIEAEGASDDVMSDPMTGRKLKPVVFSAIAYENLRGATNPNPATYQEGTLVTFSNPGTLIGYTFAGWTPAQLTTEMTGAQTVRAAWTANSYSIVYNPNGGSGTMDATAAAYDSVTNVAANGFTYSGHVFAGWATNETGEVVYAAGQTVSNLTAQSSGVVTLYAVWEDLVVAAPTVVPGNGTVFTEESCTVTLSCATEGADIYYNIGSAPRATSRYLYSGPFTITDTAEIYAFARKDGINSDPVTKVTITKRSLTLAEAAGAAELAFTTGGDASWTPVGDATAASGFSARSGMIGDASETWIQTSVAGIGTFSFSWKVECEEDYIAHEAGWDHLAVSTNGANGAWIEVSRIDGASGWQPMSITFADAGTHTIRWTFVKDGDQEEVFADLAWLSGVTWTPRGSAEPPFPEVATNAAPEVVTAALSGAADAGLAANVTDGTNYNAFCEWAARVKGASGSAAAGAQAVKESVRAWLSYALGADRLITKEPTSEDVKIESFTPSSTDGKFEFTVSVKDVNIGGGSVAEAVLKENLKKVLGIEGAASLTPAAFSSDNIDITFDTPQNGKARFTATPPIDAGTTFFMRVKVK